MRAAFVSTVHGHTWPGSEFLWGGLAERLLESGDKVFARCSQDFVLSHELQKLIKNGLVYQPFSGSTSRGARMMQQLIDPFRRLKAWHPDVLLVSAGSAFDISYSRPLVDFLRATPIPFITLCQFNAETFPVDQRSRALMKEVYGRAAQVVFVAEDNHRLTERQLAVKLGNVKIVMEPFPIRLEAPLPWPSMEEECWNFACVARWQTLWKGQDVLFEVLGQPQWQKRQWQLNLYGEGKDEDYLKELASLYGISERVKFVGFVSDRKAIWLDNHIQIFPTRGEGGPMVLTEGMMCGRPAVITKCGHVADYIDDGINGFAAGFATAEVFAEALEKAWARRHEWKEMGERAHAKLAQMRSFDPVAELLEVVHEVAGATESRGGSVDQ